MKINIITIIPEFFNSYFKSPNIIRAFKHQRLEINIIDLKDTKVTGYITKDDTDSYNLDLVLDGILVLPDSVSLNPVDVPFSTEIYGNYAEMMEEIQEIAKKSNNSLDIFPIIWENILLLFGIIVCGGEYWKIS